MAKRYFKNMQIAGRAFCIYNTNKTGIMPIYKVDGKTYAKPRKPAANAEVINGVKNLVMCAPCIIGLLTGYQQIKQ